MSVYKSKTPTKDVRSWFFSRKKKVNGETILYNSKKYTTKKEAQEAEALFLLKRDMPSRENFRIVAYSYIDYLKKSRKEATVYSNKSIYWKHISPFFDKYDITDIKVSDINNWKEIKQNEGYSVKYLNKMYEILKCILEHGVKNYSLESNPATVVGRFESPNDEVIKDEEKIRYITKEEFDKFISVIDDITWKTFFIFLYYTGMRKGEVQALTWNDINFTTNEITVNKTLSVKTEALYKITSTKNNQNRKVKMSKRLVEQLNEYHEFVKQYTDYSDNWFVFGCIRFLSQTTIDRYKHKYFELSGVNEITIHEFRHSHVSLLINEYVKNGGTDTAKFFIMMSNRLGHTVGVMQKTYMHLFPTIQDEIVDILDNI